MGPVSLRNIDNQADFTLEWTINWSIVNEPVPDNYFDPHSLPDGIVQLVSVEADNPVIIGKIGHEHKAPEALTTPEKHDYSQFRYILMGLGVFFIILSLGVKAYAWWKK